MNISLISQVLALSLVLGAWNGRQTSLFLTSNRLVKSYRCGVDSVLNSVTVKQLFVYDYKAFVKALNLGIEFVYQTKVYQLQRVNKKVSLVILDKNRIIEYQGYLNAYNMTQINISYLNRDILDVLNGIVKLGL